MGAGKRGLRSVPLAEVVAAAEDEGDRGARLPEVVGHEGPDAPDPHDVDRGPAARGGWVPVLSLKRSPL